MSLPMQPSEPPVAARDAATVILLRDTEPDTGNVEVFLQRRVSGMAFAGGMTVFPGGSVDERDAELPVDWAGPSPKQWAQWFFCSESLARALVSAAIRETFEESGVLLAGTESSVVTDTARYADARRALVAKELSLAAFLAEAGLTLRSDLLRPWANWVTPESEPRRYDTRFFVAALPTGQQADGATTEAESTGWQRPGDALADAELGNRILLPPTWHTLTEIGSYASTEEILSVTRTIHRIGPKLSRMADVMRGKMP